MARNTSILIGEYYESFINKQIATGKYNSVSEVVRTALRHFEQEENKIIALKNAINEGIESGIAKDFDPKKHLESLKAKKRNG